MRSSQTGICKNCMNCILNGQGQKWRFQSLMVFLQSDEFEKQSNDCCMSNESDCISKLHKYFRKIMRFRGENHFLLTSQCLPVYLKILILLFQDISTRCQFEITQKKKRSSRSFLRKQHKRKNNCFILIKIGFF